MKAYKFLVLFAFSCTVSVCSFAIDFDSSLFGAAVKEESPTEFVESKKTESEECDFSTRPMRISIRHIEANGIGYNTGYSTLEAFLALRNKQEGWIPFVDLRGHVFDNAQLAANAGLGVRHLSKMIWGANLYYDYRHTSHQHYNQIGAGLEAMTAQWEFRVNGYLPVGEKKSHYFDTRRSSVSSFAGFEGFGFMVTEKTTIKDKNEYAFKGIDAEAGYHFFKKKNLDLYLAAGPYYYKGYYDKQAIGGKARLGVNLYEMVTLEVINSYDSLFHEIFQGKAGLNIPFGPRKKLKKRNNKSCSEALAFNQRLFQDVQRQEIVVLKNHHRTRVTETSSPASITSLEGGAPAKIIYVNNTNPNPGDGTAGNPFQTLDLASAASTSNDIIYVFSGNGTTSGMNNGFVLKDFQQLLGSGISQTILTSDGPINIPQMTPTSPTITNLDPLSNVIVLANNVKVRGINTFLPLADTGRANIFGTLVENPIIDSCTTTGETYGIHLIDCADKPLIQYNLCNSSIHCIAVENFISEVDGMRIQSNTTDNAGIPNGVDGIFVSFAQQNIDDSTIIINNTTLNNFTGSGIRILGQGTGGQSFLVSTNETHNNLFGMTIEVTDSALSFMQIQNNNLTSSAAMCFVARIPATATTNAGLCINLLNNVADLGLGYDLQNLGSNPKAFSLEPENAQMMNVGPINETGSIIHTDSCTIGS